MKAIRIKNAVFGTNGSGLAQCVFEAGSVQPADDPRAQHALQYGNGEEIDVPDVAPEAAEPATPRAKKDKASA